MEHSDDPRQQFFTGLPALKPLGRPELDGGFQCLQDLAQLGMHVHLHGGGCHSGLHCWPSLGGHIPLCRWRCLRHGGGAHRVIGVGSGEVSRGRVVASSGGFIIFFLGVGWAGGGESASGN